MIASLEIRGFKRITAARFDIAPLTVLSGLNGSGKTTVLQSLLLCREVSRSETDYVALNGPFGLALGSAQDVLNLNTAVDTSRIDFTVILASDTTLRFVLNAKDAQALNLPIELRPKGKAPGALGGPNRAFSYLCAERLGPRDVLRASAMPTIDLAVGTQGEYCAHVLAVLGLQEKVSLRRRHRKALGAAFLKYQVEAWLSEIVRPTEIDTTWFQNTAITALRYRSPGGDWVRAPNMGFGVSYALPIVLAGLISPEDSLLIVENPEAHLHPAGQSKIGAFLATLAADGVQVVLETHSDHVLNGIRRAIGESKTLNDDSALVHFFGTTDEGAPEFLPLRFTPTGGLSNWPKRFFDQYEIDVAALARIRRPRA